MFIFPFRDLSSFRNTVVLEPDLVLSFEFNFLSFPRWWTYSVYTPDNEPLLTGQRISANIELMGSFSYRTGLKGELWATWHDSRMQEFNEDSFFKEEAFLTYLTEEDLLTF